MQFLLKRIGLMGTSLPLLLAPGIAAAQDLEAPSGGGSSAFIVLAVIIASILFAVLLTRVWVGIFNVSLLDVEPISSIEKRHPYLPSFRIIAGAVAITSVLGFLAIKTLGLTESIGSGLALKIGIVALCVYEGEGHGFRQPEHQLDEYRRIGGFIAEHVG